MSLDKDLLGAAVSNSEDDSLHLRKRAQEKHARLGQGLTAQVDGVHNSVGIFVLEFLPSLHWEREYRGPRLATGEVYVDLSEQTNEIQ